MYKILVPGKSLEYVQVCDHCDCKFSFEMSDIIASKTVVCPHCGEEMFFENRLLNENEEVYSYYQLHSNQAHPYNNKIFPNADDAFSAIPKLNGNYSDGSVHIIHKISFHSVNGGKQLEMKKVEVRRICGYSYEEGNR